MKLPVLLLVAFWLSAFGTCWAQAPAEVAPVTLNFCGVELPLESGCTSESKYQMACGNYQLTWMYLDFSLMKTYPAQFIKQAEKKHKGTEKQPFECVILDGPPAQGVRLSYPTEAGGMAYQLIVYGNAKGQPVLLDITLPIDPEKTADLPATVQKIIRLPK
ncbi:hypothetical protein ACFPAF_00345 [Hymenobacter endophyticus]|uniref:DUF4251 domain-containing protein n=1 Tax=Hymenobacter endophyticus TaxID=3076335 RepID=A0ABU3TBT0_9BACT|nr:hypothetical protein [Hymenobacter endophyticus]MDU0368827.1 hypothetical protein [Hymenobacter endophyticus]